MNHTIKMIVSDLDGTLLRSDKTISGYTKDVLEKCRNTGIKVVYATARGASTDRVIPSELFDGRVTSNGAAAYAGVNRVYNRSIPCMTARPILLACDRRGLKTASEASGMHYSNFSVSDVWPGFDNFEIVDFRVHDKDAVKLYTVINNNDDIEFIDKLLPDDLYLSVSSDALGMIMHKEATKSKAVAELARNWNIMPNEIAAFGDEQNDIDMLIYAGIGVAMQNALDEVKAVANAICPSNDEDGVAAWIAKNVLR